MGRAFVVNASPLILLARIGRLDLLSSLTDEIAIPQSVLDEVAAGAGHDDAVRLVRDFAEAKLVDDTEIPDRIRSWTWELENLRFSPTLSPSRSGKRFSMIAQLGDAPG